MLTRCSHIFLKYNFWYTMIMTCIPYIREKIQEDNQATLCTSCRKWWFWDIVSLAVTLGSTVSRSCSCRSASVGGDACSSWSASDASVLDTRYGVGRNAGFLDLGKMVVTSVRNNSYCVTALLSTILHSTHPQVVYFEDVNKRCKIFVIK